MKKLLLVSLLYVAMNSVFAQSPTNGLVASYPFNGNANDESGNGNNGTVNGATLTTDRFGKANSAYSFDGTNDYIQCISNITNLDSISISGWVYLNNTEGGNYVQIGVDGSEGCNGLGIGNGTGAFTVNGLSLLTLESCIGWNNSGVDVTSQNWFHFILIKNKNVLSYYLNGIMKKTQIIKTPISPTSFIFLGSSSSSTFFHNGKLDDIKIYNKALTASEITALYNDNNSGLVAHYPFNGNANDESGNGNNGTVNGATLTTDRFGKANSAYSFDGVSNKIVLINQTLSLLDSFSISTWVSISNLSPSFHDAPIISQWNGLNMGQRKFAVGYRRISTQTGMSFYLGDVNNTQFDYYPIDWNPSASTWYNFITVFKPGVYVKTFVNGLLHYSNTSNVPTKLVSPTNAPIEIGHMIAGAGNLWFNGKIDDIKIYNGILSASEISELSNSTTCIQTITVTDTLRISKVTGFNTLPENFGNIKVYPNPANDVLTINISKPNADYSIKILDNLGKAVYTTPMNSANLQVNLNQFTARGLYLLQIINKENQILDVRKLVLE